MANAVEVRPIGPFRVEVQVRPARGATFEQVKGDIERALRDEGMVAVLYDVVPYIDTAAASEPLSPRLQAASYASDQTTRGLKETLVKAVPSLGRAVFEEEPGHRVRILVAAQDGTCPPSLTEQVRATLETVGYAGLPFTVSPLPTGDIRNELASEVLLPRRDTDIVKLTEEDEDRYATWIRKLVNDAPAEKIPLVDAPIGSKVLVTPTFKPPLPLACLLPFYDRIFVQMPFEHVEGTDYFQHYFECSEANFVAYCKHQRVIPIFKFNLGLYPRKVVDPWLQNYSLSFISPRQFDYIGVRYAWQTSPYLRLLREDPRLATEISQKARTALLAPRAQPQIEWLPKLLDWMSFGSEFFEGVAWHRGHLALANLSSGGPIAHFIASTPSIFANKDIASFVSIETFGAVMNIATAQAFDASLSEGMLLNEGLLQLVLPFFQDAREVLSPSRTTQLSTLIESLDLKYSGRIPATEYLDVLDTAETRRIREIAHVLLGDGPNPAKDLELRERVRQLNEEILRIEKRAIETAGVDVIGDLARAGATATGSGGSPMTLGFKLLADLLQIPTLQRVSAMAFEKTVEDTPVGDALDRIRGVINGVSPQAIRIYRLRKKLTG